MVAALTMVMLAAGAIAPASASATGCKIYTNPGQVSFNPSWQFNGDVYAMGFTGTLYTGDSSSGCNDINIKSLSNTGECYNPTADVAVQYLSGGVWHTDSAGAVQVTCNSSSLKVIGSNYANNTAFRVLINVGRDANFHQGWAWPTFQLYV